MINLKSLFYEKKEMQDMVMEYYPNWKEMKQKQNFPKIHFKSLPALE